MFKNWSRKTIYLFAIDRILSPNSKQQYLVHQNLTFSSLSVAFLNAKSEW